MVNSISEKFTEENKTEESVAAARVHILKDKEGAESLNESNDADPVAALNHSMSSRSSES